MDTTWGYFVAVLAGAIAVTVTYVKYMDSQKELRKMQKAMSRLVQLQNKVKIRYVNNTNLMDYLRLKYHTNTSQELEKKWEFYQQELVNQLRKRQLCGVAKTIVEILVFVLRCCNVRTDNDRFYTKTQVRRKINEKDNNAFHLGIMNLAVEFAKDPQKIKRALLVFLCQLCKLVFDHQWDVDQLATMISYDAEERESCPTALDQYYDDGIKVQLNTVHGVKGETHNATLYLETEHRRGSDLKRIMPLFEDKCFRNEGVYETSRRCAYVGMSRPRDLLCVAMRETTYEGHEPAFEDDWNVIHLQ